VGGQKGETKTQATKTAEPSTEGEKNETKTAKMASKYVGIEARKAKPAKRRGGLVDTGVFERRCVQFREKRQVESTFTEADESVTVF